MWQKTKFNSYLQKAECKHHQVVLVGVSCLAEIHCLWEFIYTHISVHQCIHKHKMQKYTKSEKYIYVYKNISADSSPPCKRKNEENFEKALMCIDYVNVQCYDFSTY